MKILFTISSLNAGGAERVLSTLANYWSHNGHTVIVIKMDDKDSFYNIDSRITLISLGMFKKNLQVSKKIIHNIVIVKTLAYHIKKHCPDIVISFMDRANIYTTLASISTNRKTIISERTNCNGLSSKLWRFLRRIVYPYANGLVVLSDFDFKHYHYVSNKRIIYNPVRTRTNTKTANIVNIAKKEKIIMAVGRLEKVRCFDILLYSIFFINKKFLRGWKVLIVGDGNEKNYLNQLLQKLSLHDIVQLIGTIKDIERYYSKASIYVSTSRSEGFPNALAEAMSYGCACVATDCLTGPSELIEDRVNGFLTEVNNIFDIRNKLELLLVNERLRKSLGYAAIESVKKYNLESIAKEWEDFIALTISKSKKNKC